MTDQQLLAFLKRRSEWLRIAHVKHVEGGSAIAIVIDGYYHDGSGDRMAAHWAEETGIPLQKGPPLVGLTGDL